MHSCKETLPSSVKIECMSVEAGFYFGKPNWIRTDLKILFYIEIKDYVLCSNNIFENVNFLFFFVLSTQSVQFLFSPIQRDISEHSQTWRHTATVLFNKQTHQILQLFSCVSSFTYGNNFTNPSSNFFIL